MNDPVLFDHDLERTVLGAILSSASETFPKCEVLTTEHFHDLKHRNAFAAMLKLYEDRLTINVINLQIRLTESGFDIMPWRAYFSELPDKVSLRFDLALSVKRLSEYRSARELHNAVSLLSSEGIGSLSRVVNEVDSATRAYRASDAGRRSAYLVETLQQCRFNPDIPPPQMIATYSLGVTSICTPGNLTAITALKSAGKTAFIGGMLAAAMAGPNSARDTLSVVSNNLNGFGVIHVDTEQSKHDYWHAIRRATRRAGLSREPEWLLSCCLTGIADINERRELFRHMLVEGSRRFGGIHSAIIDGAADLVHDVNDPKEANAFVAELHALATQYNTPIVGVIHFNPGTDKVRGHLGSQLERKAETNLRLDKVSETTVIWSDKQRGAPIPKSHGTRFTWSNEAEMHVSCGSVQTISTDVTGYQLEVERVFDGRPSMRYADLKSTVMTVLQKEERTAERRIKKWDERGLIRKVANLWKKAA